MFLQFSPTGAANGRRRGANEGRPRQALEARKALKNKGKEHAGTKKGYERSWFL
jgi:hypothetical protein